jgi:hypothetical protein
MNTRYLTLLATLVLLAFTVSAFAKGKPGGNEATAEYTAVLIAGDFVFGEMKTLTANNKGTELPGNAVLEMGPRPSSNTADSTWEDIFGDCSLLVTGGVVTGFGVSADNWSISYTKSRGNPNKIHITMRDLIVLPGTSGDYSQVQFDLDLHGEFARNSPFLPEAKNDSIIFELKQYTFWGGAAGNGGFTCNSDGWPLLIPISELVITRTK